MNTCFLSIIIPAYNASKDISRCLASIWSQGLSPERSEVICVDDCSTDDSCQVIEREMALHPNLRLIRNEVNRRAGGVRNHGVNEAKGEYILFIDADDYFHPGALRKAVEHLQANPDLDILTCNFARELPDAPSNEMVHQYKSTEKYDVNGYIANAHIPCAPWQWLFRRSLMTDNQIWFREHCISEDVDWTHRLFLKAKWIQYQPILLTHYVIGTDTQTALSYASPRNVYAYMEAGKELWKLRQEYDAIGGGNYLRGMATGYICQGLKYYLAMWDSCKQKVSHIQAATASGIPLHGKWRAAQICPWIYSILTNLFSPFVRMLLRWRAKRVFRGIKRG